MKEKTTIFKYPTKIIGVRRTQMPNNNGILLSIPHSGREYPKELIKNTHYNQNQLRYFEDPYVDHICIKAALINTIPLIKARFPRAWADPNRANIALDERLRGKEKNKIPNIYHNHIKNGLGVIPTKMADGKDIYKILPKPQNINTRLENTWNTYHRQLNIWAEKIKKKCNICLIIDMHSMPSLINEDIIIGTQYNQSCPPDIIAKIEHLFNEEGYKTARDTPFAGGYITQKYSKNSQNIGAIQIEINRKLYLNEKTCKKTSNFKKIRNQFTKIISAMNNYMYERQRFPTRKIAAE